MVVLLGLSEKDRNIIMKRWLKEVHLKKDEDEKINLYSALFLDQISSAPLKFIGQALILCSSS